MLPSPYDLIVFGGTLNTRGHKVFHDVIMSVLRLWIVILCFELMLYVQVDNLSVMSIGPISFFPGLNQY